MADKLYLVKQERKFNGDVTTASFTVKCDTTQIEAIVSKLAGVITVYEQNTGLSSAEDASNLVVGGLPIDSISMVHSEAKTVYVGAYNKPILFKENVSVTELQTLFKAHTPFGSAFATEHPDNVYPRIGSMGNL